MPKVQSFDHEKGGHSRRARRQTTAPPPGDAPPPPFDDLRWAYQTLGVPSTASDREIHLAWRQKRIENHPDHAGADRAEFDRRSRISAEINRARDIIIASRADYGRRAA